MKTQSPTLPIPSKKADTVLAQQRVRWWFVTPEGRIVRGLSWSDYSYCEFGEFPRDFTLILPADDPRPLGWRMFNKPQYASPDYIRSMGDVYLACKTGVWYGPSLAPSREAPPYQNCTALVVREERAA